MTMSPTTSVLLGLDGFAVCLALGPLGLGVRSSIPLIGLFGVCDGLALLAGSAVHLSPDWSSAVWPELMGVWAVLVLLLMVSGARLLLPLLPVLLACDNLLAGAVASRAGVLEDAALSCAVSVVLAAAGLVMGQAFGRHLPLRPSRLAGAGLLLATGFAAMAG
jgi:hypothetical protein